VNAVDYARGETPAGAWEQALGKPGPRLAHLIDAYHGYSERSPAALLRLEVPFPGTALILGFGDPIAVSTSGHPEDLEGGYLGFLAGISCHPALVESRSQAGVQVNLTPLGAYHLFGVAMEDLTNRVVRLRDLLGVIGDEIIERLREAPSWEQRFALLDALFLRALCTNRPPTEAVAWAWRQVRSHPGEVPIRDLAGAIGWSHKHLIARFRHEVGVSPHLAGRIVRFDRAARRLAAPASLALSTVALDSGYYDQAHMVREFREFARCTPREFRARQMLEGGVSG
jgi:AraC-like DNA-binding protein